MNEEERRRLVRAAVDRIIATDLRTSTDEYKAPLAPISYMENGRIIPRPPEEPEVAGDCLARDLMQFENDPALDEFIEDHQPIVERWTLLPGEALPLPEPVTFDELEAGTSKRDLVEPEGEA